MIEFEYKGKKIVAMSDTHGGHRKLDISSCDILIHCGDVCNAGDMVQIKDFFDWFSALSATHKIFVSGNHDLPFELNQEFAQTLIPSNVTFLNNGIIDMDGIVIAGIEATMGLLNDIDIDERVDILVSHCAPYGVADENGKGCRKLKKLICDTHPAISIFGHFHTDGGSDQTIDGIRYINVSSYNIISQND